MDNHVTCEWVDGKNPLFERARAVRRKVFVEEQGFSLIGEFDERDPDCLHVLAYLDGACVGTARVFSDHPGDLHVGRIAVLSECRGRGLGLALMREVERKAAELSMQRVVLDAQQVRAGFYEKAGYAQTGKTSVDEGCPHVEMVRVVNRTAPAGE